MSVKYLHEIAVELAFDAYSDRILFITKRLRMDPAYTYVEWDAEMRDMEMQQERHYLSLKPELKKVPGSEVIEFYDEEEGEEHA